MENQDLQHLFSELELSLKKFKAIRNQFKPNQVFMIFIYINKCIYRNYYTLKRKSLKFLQI